MVGKKLILNELISIKPPECAIHYCFMGVTGMGMSYSSHHMFDELEKEANLKWLKNGKNQ